MGDATATLGQVQAALGTYAPYVMLAAGVLLLMVPRWLRAAIAVVLIGFGLAGIWPGLVDGGVTIAR